MGIPAHEHGTEARDTGNMGKDAHATDPHFCARARQGKQRTESTFFRVQ
jgi:hypothetical protein